MEKMPYKIKQKLRKLQKLLGEAREAEKDVCDLIESYGVDIKYLNATNNHYESISSTEGLAYICNAEGDIENNIREIEIVFLDHVNKQ